MTRRLRLRIVVGLAVAGAVAACAADPLNPQPLPPLTNDDGPNYQDGGFVIGRDSGTSTSADGGDVRGDDAGMPPNEPSDASDAGPADAGDAGDADADAGPT